MNDVKLFGRLCKDWDVRIAGNGNSYAFNTIAVDKSYTNKAGEKEKAIVFVNFSLWGKLLENAVKFTAKGGRVIVEGCLDNKKKDEGYTELIFNARNMRFVDFAERDAAVGSPEEDEETPF